MSATDELDFPERPITIRVEGSREAFEFNPPDDLWLDMRAYCLVTGLTIEELIKRALTEQLPRMVKDGGRDATE